MQFPITAEMAQHRIFRFLSNLPSETYIYAMLGSVLASAILYMMGRRHTALFVGEWAPTFAALGLFYKLLRPSGTSVGEQAGQVLGQLRR